ncbi:TT21B protein, partial [Acromyrmex insinuator]
MDEAEHVALIEWYYRQHYYNGMLTQVKQACDAYPNSERLKLLYCLANILIGKNHEAIKESSSLLNYVDVTLPALLVQSVALVDSEVERSTVTQIENRIRDERRKASCISLCLAASVLLLSHRADKAKEYVDRASKMKPMNINVLFIKGWLELSLRSGTDVQEAGNSFDFILKEEPRNLGALLGSAETKRRIGDYPGAVLILNSLIVRYPKQPLPLIEKMKCLLAAKDWEQVLEMVNRVLTIESNNLDGIKASSMVALCRDGNPSEGLPQLQLFLRNLLLVEPKNTVLLIENLRLFSDVAFQDHGILLELARTAEKMLQATSSSAELMAELGNLYAALGNVKDAERWYKNTIRTDPSSFVALLGLAHCQLLQGSAEDLDQARQQVEIMMEIQPNSTNVQLLFMSAKITSKENSIKALGHLDTAANILLKNCEGFPYGYEYLSELKPGLCLEIAKQRLMHSLNKSPMSDELGSAVEKEPSIRLLERLVEACPGSSVATLLLSKARMQSGDYEGALILLKRLLDTVEPSNAQAHLLMAQILAYQGKYQLASQNLEVGLSYNFKIRDEPIYHLIIGMVQREAGDLLNCVKSCQTAMSLAGLTGSANRKSDMSTSDQATLYLELIAAYSKARRFAEALALIDEAKTNLAGTIELGRITISTAEVYLDIGELENAISCLRNIHPGQPYYLQAHTRLAEINLNYKKDRQAFAKCFRELVEHCPGPKTYSMLGNAYMSIQEPERAIEAYEQALSQNPINKADIANKMGKALVKAHQYVKAISYYKDIVKQDNCAALKLDLAKLYMKMKQYDKAEATLVQELQDKRGESDILNLEMRGQELLLLAKVREKSGNIRGALATLKEAKENQHRYIQRLPAVSPDVADQKHMLANICLTMADYASTLRNYDEAIVYYKEALAHKPTDVNALLSLAKLYMQMNNLDRCAQNCSILLNADPNNEAASVMMADLAFRKVDFDTAAFHFRQLLLRQPTYWTALARLIEVSRRTGAMDDLDEWLQRAQIAMSTGNVEAGFYYCAGLLDWRTGKLNSALRNFNFARRDPEWGQQAIYNMIEICLDPDDDTTLSNEAFNDDDTEYQDSRTMALRTAYRLLQELNPKGSPHEELTHKLLSNFFLLATKQKSNIEKALQDCTALASQETLRDHVGPALGMATAHILLKQTPRARNHLKRVSKNVWTFEDAEYLERCWLLLADIYVQSSKYELANELLRRVLQHNATCVRAHELSGYIAEKDQNYREAAARYGQAWKCGGKTKLSVGYKLAYCCLKAKVYADAIEACNEVLKQNTDYPRIRKDILEKCINNLRT